MNWLIGKALSVQRALTPAILCMVAVGSYGTCLAVGPNCQAANRPAVICGNSITIYDAPAANRSGAICDSRVWVVDEPVVPRLAPQSEPQEIEIEKPPLIAEPQPDREPAQSDEQRKRTDILSDKVDDLFKSMAAQRENRTRQERAQAERRRAEAERTSQREEVEQQRLLAEARHKRQRKQAQGQREQVQEQLRRAETLRGNLDGGLEVVAADVRQMLQATRDAEDAAQRKRMARQERVQAQRRRAAPAAEAQTDAALLRTTATAGSGIPDSSYSSYFVLAGLLVIIAAICWYSARSIKGPVGKLAGSLEVVGCDVKKMLQAARNMPDAAPHERAEAERKRFAEQTEKRLQQAEDLGGDMDRILKVVVNAEKMLQEVQDTSYATRYESEVQREWPKPKRQDMEIGGDKVDSLGEVVTVGVKANLSKGVEFQGVQTIDELTAAVKGMLSEASRRNRDDERSAAARGAHGTRPGGSAVQESLGSSDSQVL